MNSAGGDKDTLVTAVVDMNCPELFVAMWAALAGIEAPLTFTTVVACDPEPGPAVTSPVS